MSNNIIKATALSMVALPAAAHAADKAPVKQDGRPNIVVIMADDLLSSELSCYGGQNLKTPNIDRLAAEGVRFTNNYASEAMSVPIRASLYTGLYPARHGSYQNHKFTYEGTKTVNEYMPEVGYRVGRTGKDHPGPKSVYKFDEIPGFTVGCTAAKAPYSTDGIEKWMSESDEPFLLYVMSINSHAPWTWGDPSEFNPDEIKVPGNCVDSPEMREIMCKYLAEVRALDNEVGSVLETLEKIGKLDNTIVMFLGEQGPQFPGGKWTLWNPGVNSAMIARYPARIKAGRVTDAIVQYEDILPTFIDIAGGEPCEELDGVSFKDVLYGESKTARKYAYGIHNNYPEGRPYPIRSIRDERYALILNLTPDKQYHEKHLMATSNNKTGVWPTWQKAAESDERAEFLCDRFVDRPAIEFYDLKKDPWEMNNLADEKKYQEKIAEMKAELLRWMESQGDTGADMDEPFNNAIAAHDKAIHIKGGWIRDPYIVLGPDNMYYLTGTTPNEGEPREQTDKYNTGLGDSSLVGNQLRIWKSKNLVEWEYLGTPYNTKDLPLEVDYKKGNASRLWAPELHWTGERWVMIHCPSVVSTLAMTEGADIKGPWTFPNIEEFNMKHDPSLFKDGNKWYITYSNGLVAPIKNGFKGVGEEFRIDPADRKIGHEGTTIMKIGRKYVFFGTGWSTDEGRKGTYNLYYCTADDIHGPYTERRFVGRFLGHGTPFQDREGRWWCTAFFNGNVPPLKADGIQTKDLGETAQTINQLGTTIVPLDVRILPDGDVYIRAKDPRYGTPGPDEVTEPAPKFRLGAKNKK